MNIKTNLAVRQLTLVSLLLALIIGGQFLFRPYSQFIVGTWVNIILVLASLLLLLPYSLTLGFISPFLAFILGIQLPNFWLVPFVGIGNAILILIIYLFGKIKSEKRFAPIISISGIISGAALKSVFLYFCIVILLTPFLELTVGQAALVSSAFSIIQLITALSGGLLAFFLAISIKRAIKYPKGE